MPIVPSALLSLDAVASNTDYYHSILEPFFFELLNKRVERRHESLREVPFSTVPYLNGGLFSPQYSDFYNQNSFNGAGTPGLTHIPDSWFTELFTVLEQYNFTVDENTSYDVDLSIDPEMLGRIFENLLAEINPETGESARKSTGSFYTPREIVDYMVDSSLLEFLKSKTGVSEKKLKALISYGTADDEQYPLLDAEKEKVVSALASLTILDPACGSGAFPIGILQKVVYVLQRVDEKAELWLQNQLKTISSPELRRDIEEKYRNENYDYLRKLGVIRESIFGVDIQTIATEISKLRCFLTLVIEEDVDDNARNRGIRPLPNLDFKFVTANSLLGLPDSSKSSKLNLFEDTSHIDRLKDIRNRYFGADADERARLQVEFKDLQLTMFKSRLASMGATSDLYNILSDWNPFNHEKTEWFDSEWMFGVVDFDIVIANPPYVDSEHMVNEDVEYRTRVKEAYSTAQGNWDLFIPFIEKGIRETKELGVLTYIVPNKIIGAKYATELRSFLDKLDVLEIRDYSRINVFSEADVYPITICVRKSKKTESKADFVVMKDLTSVMRGVSILGSELGIDTYWDKYFLEPNAFKLIHKLSKLKKIKDSGLFIAGAATVGEAYKVKECVKDSNSISNSFKLVNTGTIDKYEALWGKQNTQYIKAAYKYPVVTYEDIKKINNTRFEQSKSPKLIIAGMSNEIEAFLDIEGEYLAGKSTTIVTGDPDKIAYYLAILNSKLVSYYVSNLYHSLKMAGGYLNISKNIIENIPLPLNDNVKIREKITSIAKQKHVTPKDIAKIDDLVYKLHDLTPDEIAIVENSSK